MKRVFIAATKQNDGKTTVSLGLICNFQARFKRVGFIKPIGQRYLEEEGLKVDEDSILIEEVCGIKCNRKDMSPIAVEKGFTERYIERPDKNPISRQIRDSFCRVSKGQQLVIVEGTGHAGVGSVFDHSNATVARLLGCKAIIISSGGVGRPIDEIVLNKALFEKEGVKVLGAIINKVLPSKFEKINRLVRKGLTRKGINVLGVIPYNPALSFPTPEQILEETDFKLLSGKEHLEQYISSVLVGAMKPNDAMKYIVDDSLLITPSDREDIIEAVLGCRRSGQDKRLKICGVVFSGGSMPAQNILDALSKEQIPVLLANSDTYDVATTIHDLTVKIRPRDTVKITTAVKMIRSNVDLDAILKGM
ncbi:MAG: AAA family ATPase [Candidatus Omnitrophica bacterium]|nr:AAA family ATPase [Candidatus Omnitrophota bacterium]